MVPEVRIRSLRQPVSTFAYISGEGRKLRAKCGVLSARNAPESASSRRIRPLRRAFSPCEIRTVRFSGLDALWTVLAQPSRFQEIDRLHSV